MASREQPPNAPRRVAMGTVCVFDDEGVLREKRPMPVDALETYRPRQNERVFGHPVDNQVGRYQFFGKAFWPIDDGVSARVQANPKLLEGLMALATAIRAADVLADFPAETAAAIEWYEGTFGRRGG